MPILLTILGISLLIFIHEFGHFLCARLAGVKVHIFSLGFGPRIWGFRRGGTDYRLSALPLGGYVMVAGDDPTVDRKLLGPNDLCSKSFTARALFYSGGVIMNLLFALVAFPLVFNTGVLFDDTVLGTVVPGHAAWEAGMQKSDKVLKVGDKQVHSFNAIITECALANPKKGIEVTYERGGEQRTTRLFPRYSMALGLRTIGADRAVATGPYEMQVVENSPAFAAGLRNGDVLLEFEGRKVFRIEDYDEAQTAYLQGRATGKTAVTLKVRRPRAEPGVDVESAGEELTITFEPKTNEKLRRIGVAPLETQVIGMRSNPDVQALGLKRNDYLTFVQGKPFRGTFDWGEAGDTIQVTVMRGPEGAPWSQLKPVELSAVVPAARRPALVDAIALGATTVHPIVKPTPGSPAAVAGMRTGDTIQAINGKPASTWEGMVKEIRAAGEKEIQITVVRDSGFANLTMKAAPNPLLECGPIVKPKRVLFQTDSLGEAISAGCTASMDFVKQIYVTLRKFFTGDVSTKNLGGIITISVVSYDNAQRGMTRLFYLLALISINLAVLNVLPIPVLDGGHLTFLLIEKIKGSPVNTKVHNYSQVLGVVFILALMVYVTFNDIVRWFG